MTLPDVQRLDTYSIPKGFRGRSGLTVLLWWLIRDTLFLCSPQPMYAWRRWLLRLFGAKIGKGAIIRPTVRITYPWMLDIGEKAQIGDFVELYTLGPITIGENAVVSQKSYLCTGSHRHRSPSFDIYAKPIVVEAQAWVAADVFIGPGVTVGYGAVISARSTLMRDAPPLKILAGNPAQIVGDRIAKAELEAITA